MNYAVIGTGYWGSNHARVAAELLDEGEIDDVVLCDVDEERAAELAATYDVDYTTDYADLPERGVDAATIATPSPTHRDVATDLLESGVDCLVEKPLALTSEDAWEIVDVAEREGRTLGVGHIFRYHPALRDLKERVDRGELGRIKYLNTNRFSFRVPRATAGVLYSLAVHDVDVSNWLLDAEPDTVYCNLDCHVREDVDETATIVLDYGDATSVVNESWQVPVFGKRRDLTVVGTEQVAYVDYLEDVTVELYDATVTSVGDELRVRDEGKQVYETERREPLAVEAREFLDAARRGEQPVASGTVGARTVELLEHCRSSSEHEEIVPVE